MRIASFGLAAVLVMACVMPLSTNAQVLTPARRRRAHGARHRD